ncbi:hypothetical protein K2173_009273 [Erythroxylum novogranatense]|uniref:Phototropic-responsive NPH3 family protein n=1 Tax=Erythroxylum novogranatense TaxID=1862640 RepID=A0AAV8SYS5_9ROSI|nr:hypothetical protein K2173_009273 [Erythroxylum novogranatense]
MSRLCDLVIQVNGRQTFFLNQKTLSAYSGKLKKIIIQENEKAQIRTSRIRFNDFPGGSDGFELVYRFCYNNGRIEITVSNVSLLYCCAVFLEMTEEVCNFNLVKQTETFLEGTFIWPWNHIVSSLKSCASFLTYADSYGLVQKLISALLVKIRQNSDANPFECTSSSSSRETPNEFRFLLSTKATPGDSSIDEWWFDDLTTLHPTIIDKFVQNLGAYKTKRNCSILTRFLLHYLKIALQCKRRRSFKNGAVYSNSYYTFSCRGLFSVLRTVSKFGLSKVCRDKLERLISGMLDQATLDDLLVSGSNSCVYDVNMVLRLMRMFVDSEEVSEQRMKKVGRLIDKYLGEIAPDQNLSISKFLEVAESLPDSARDCFSGVYRAIDIYLESHPCLPFEVRSRLCRCLNYKKLSFEACKDLAKNPRIPPNVAVQALMSLNSSKTNKEFVQSETTTTPVDTLRMISSNGIDEKSLLKENEDMVISIEKMQKRVKELEKVCREMKGQMSGLVKKKVMTAASPQYRALPRLCRIIDM